MKISQREAKKNLKQLRMLQSEIEHQRRAWGQEYFGGTNIASVSFSADHQIVVAVRTARKLNHAVVVIGDDGGGLRFMALPHPRVA